MKHGSRSFGNLNLEVSGLKLQALGFKGLQVFLGVPGPETSHIPDQPYQQGAEELLLDTY